MFLLECQALGDSEHQDFPLIGTLSVRVVVNLSQACRTWFCIVLLLKNVNLLSKGKFLECSIALAEPILFFKWFVIPKTLYASLCSFADRRNLLLMLYLVSFIKSHSLWFFAMLFMVKFRTSA